ncbi:hypothetical protein OXX80_001757 [Metschnikowia pulcherrima]
MGQNFSKSNAKPTNGSEGSKKLISIPDLTREPDFMEKLLLYFERNNIFQSVSVSVKINKNVPIEMFAPTIRKLVLKYPMLFMFPVGNEPKIRWEPLPDIIISDVFEINQDVTDDLLVDTFDTTLLNSFSIVERHRQKKPLWKLVYFERVNWITFHCAHCFTDGGSILAYLKEFVEYLNDVDVSAGKDQVFCIKEDLPLLETGIPAPFFERVKFRPNFRTKVSAAAIKAAIGLFPTLVTALLETRLENSLFVDRLPVPFSPRCFFESESVISETSSLNNATAMFIHLSREELSVVLAACKAHHVKFQTYVILVYVQTVHEIRPELYSQKFLKVGCAVSFRNIHKQLTDHSTYLGNKGRFDDGFYTFVAKYFLDPGTTLSWESVKKYNDFLHGTINSAEWINDFYIASHAVLPDHIMDPKMDIKKDDCFLFATNLGHVEVIDHGEAGKFQIDDILFTPSRGVTIGTHHVTMSSTSKVGLHVGFSDGDINITDWNLFRSKFKYNMCRFSGEP